MMIKMMIFSILLSLNVWGLEIAKVPKTVEIGGDNGGIVLDNSTWSSSSIKDKVYVMFYVDPDEKETNEHFTQALKAKKYDRTNYGSIAIVNLAATWKPNFIIEKILKSKQEEFPDTIYVKDKNSVLVKEWQITDNASDILIFSKKGELLFYKDGAMSEDDMQKAFKIIEDNL